ncbi:MAG: serine hydrolase domain-containing protein [Pikeienuella sp.]
MITAIQKLVWVFVCVAAIAIPSVSAAHNQSVVRYFVQDGQVQVDVEGVETSADSLFAIASIGKTFTAVAVLTLASSGKLNVDDFASNWLPNEVVVGLGGMQGVTIQHLLTMSSGLPDYYTDDYLYDALDNPDQVQNPETALSYAFDEAPLFDPGEDFDYSNTNYVLLGLIIEQATGETYASALDRLVFQAAKMTNSFVFGSQKIPPTFVDGHEDGQHVRDYYAGQGFGDGGVISNAPDLARFYQALFENRSLLPKHMLDKMLHDPIGAGYGMGIEVTGGIYGHSGGDLGFASDVRFDSASNAIAIVLIANGDAETDWAENRLETP